VATNWNEVISILLGLIESNANIRVGRDYLQEFYLYLHLFGLYSVDALSTIITVMKIVGTTGDLRDWRDMPPVVCVTLKIPREKLSVFTNLDSSKLGTPLIHCIVESSPAFSTGQRQNLFAAVQLSFGNVTTAGNPHSETFEIHIIEDDRGWNGQSPLLASFHCPTWMLLQEPRTTTVAFGVQRTPDSAGCL